MLKKSGEIFMKHLILLVAVVSLVTALVTQHDKPVQEAKNETASVSVAETAG